MSLKKLYIFVTLILFILPACAVQNSGKTKTETAASVQAPSDQGTASESMLVYEAELQPFANRIAWPTQPGSPDAQPAYVIESGVNDDGVWLEGKGYFKGSLEHIYQTLINPMIMGPTYMTDDIVISDLKQSPVLTTFVMHVKMRVVISVEFDIGVSVEALYDKDDQIIGYRYKSRKVSGTKFITRIDETIIAKKVDDTWFSVEAQSLNEASMNKEKETRKHLETLFGYWADEKQ